MDQAIRPDDATSTLGLAFDTPRLTQLLGGVDGWRRLNEQTRENAARLLEDAFEEASAGQTEEAPEDLVAGLEETVHDFTTTEAGFLPPAVRRAAFIYFVAALVLLTLMTASFTDEVTDAVLGKAADAMPFAIIAMGAAGTAWDRYARHSDDDDDEDDTDGTA